MTPDELTGVTTRQAAGGTALQVELCIAPLPDRQTPSTAFSRPDLTALTNSV